MFIKKVSLLIGLLILAIQFAFLPTGSIIRAQDGYRGDAESYAKNFNVNTDEAIYRLSIQEKINAQRLDLEAQEPDNFAGLWIDNGPQYRIIVQLLRGSKEDILKYFSDPQVADVVEVQYALTSYKSLMESQAQLQATIENISLPIGFGINVQKNDVEVYVEDRGAFEAELGRTNQLLPPNVTIVERPMPVDVKTWYGGLSLSGCTTGFTLKNRATGIRYSSTAGHCSSSNINPLTAASNFYIPDNGFDFQTLYIPTGDSAKNFVSDNIYPYYHSITSAINSTPVVGTYVCKYGKATGYGCGTINQVNISINSSPNIYFRILRSGTADFVCFTDSGGPVYAGSVAYGIIKAATNPYCTGNSTDGYALPVTRINEKGYDVLIVP